MTDPLSKEERACCLVAAIGNMIETPCLVAIMDPQGFIAADVCPRTGVHKIILSHAELCYALPALKLVEPSKYDGADLVQTAVHIARVLIAEKPGILEYPEND